MADLVAFEEQVVRFFVEAADLLGVPKSVAAIYGICFASPEPLSFSDIDERLDISSGSISQGLRVLREVGALKVVGHEPTRNPLSVIGNPDAGRGMARVTDSELRATGKPGVPSAPLRVASYESRVTASRRADRFAPDLELRKLILHWVETRLQNELTSGKSRLEQIAASIPPSLAADKTLKARFESLTTWHDKARGLLPIAKTFLKLT